MQPKRAGVSWRVKDVYSIRLLELFHPKELDIRSVGSGRWQLEADGKIYPIPGELICRSSPPGMVAFQWDGGKVVCREARLVTNSGRRFRGEYTLGIRGVLTRKYHGGLRIEADDIGLLPICEIDLEELVASVVASECSQSDPPEMMKAQAVVCRSFISAFGRRHTRYDFCDNTHCQLFFGADRLNESINRIVGGTKGLVLTAGDRIIPGYYSGACGGSTFGPASVWPDDHSASHQTGVRCLDCTTSVHYSWERELSAEEIHTATGLSRHAGLSLRIDSTGPVRAVRFLTRNGPLSIPIDEFRLRIGRKLGWNKILSNRFSLSRINNRLRIDGKGMGHGVGMCQDGARAQATRGRNFDRILTHYFPETTLSKIQDSNPNRMTE